VLPPNVRQYPRQTLEVHASPGCDSDVLSERHTEDAAYCAPRNRPTAAPHAARSAQHYRSSMSILIEACVDSVASAAAAERGGAARIELCDALFDGGTTPSAGMIAAVKERVRIPVFVIVRPRGGGFVYADDEVDVMRRDVAAARRLGADGVVIGALGADARIDVRTTRSLVDAAGGLPVTFHRAFDLVALADRDRDAALEALVEAGVARVLTSGGAPTAIEGADAIAALVARAAGRLTVLAGGGVREAHVAELVRRSGVREVHVRGTRLARTAMASPNGAVRLRKALPDDEGAWEETDEARIRDFVRAAGYGASG
jgi:copper homeostasis protein